MNVHKWSLDLAVSVFKLRSSPLRAKQHYVVFSEKTFNSAYFVSPPRGTSQSWLRGSRATYLYNGNIASRGEQIHLSSSSLHAMRTWVYFLTLRFVHFRERPVVRSPSQWCVPLQWPNVYCRTPERAFRSGFEPRPRSLRCVLLQETDYRTSIPPRGGGVEILLVGWERE